MARANGDAAGRATAKLIAGEASTNPERRLSQAQLREQARTDGIVQDRRGTSDPARVLVRTPLERLQDWAGLDKDRVFDVRYIAASEHPWFIELSNDSVSWCVRAECQESFEQAVDYALTEAAKEKS